MAFTNVSPVGGAGDDSLLASRGQDTLLGAGGNDVYYVNDTTDAQNNLTQDLVVEGATANSGIDTVYYTELGGAYTLTDNVENLVMSGMGGDDTILGTLTADQIWLRHVGNNLELSVIGTSDSFTINNWYTNAANQVETFTLANGKSLQSSNVQKLVDAMAGFTPPATGQTTLPANYQTTLNPVITANWA